LASVGNRLSTGTPYVRDLNAQVRKGETTVPQFQRPFVWEADQTLALLDCIANNYPVGSPLLWKSHENFAIELDIGDFRLPDTDALSPTE
jgi:uncharacterized protein with ParB-like and HNH nuclease domain